MILSPVTQYLQSPAIVSYVAASQCLNHVVSGFVLRRLSSVSEVILGHYLFAVLKKG